MITTKGILMASRTKKTWTIAEWIAFGNRVKDVRSEILKMAKDVQYVCRVREIDGLLRIVRQLDKWKSKMEDVAAKDVPISLITKVFYGERLPERE
jgi:hypothetical protein